MGGGGQESCNSPPSPNETLACYCTKALNGVLTESGRGTLLAMPRSRAYERCMYECGWYCILQYDD